MGKILDRIAGFFKLKELGTNFKTEVLAGIATFLTMAYIIVVNPAILSVAGMPFAGVLFATILVASLSSIAMGLYANLPYALAPGMGLNAFVAFGMVLGMGMAWQTALGAVFISGIVFIVISLPKINLREKIVKAVPKPLRLGVAAGIGLFLAFLGLVGAGVVVANPATLVAFAGLTPGFVIFLLGLVFTGFLLMKKVPGALILGVLFSAVLATLASVLGIASLVTIPTAVFAMPSLAVFFQMDILAALTIGMIAPIFSLLFTDMFDSISTFLGVSESSGLVDENGDPKNVGKALLVDAFSTTISGMFGSSPGTTYIESASGVEQGGRSGLTAIVTGLLFLPFMFLSPLLSFIPMVAVAPILVLVGLFMMRSATNIDWHNYMDAIPAFIAMIAIPLTYSITQGIVFGFLTHILLKIVSGKAKEISPTLWVIGALSLAMLLLTLL